MYTQNTLRTSAAAKIRAVEEQREETSSKPLYAAPSVPQSIFSQTLRNQKGNPRAPSLHITRSDNKFS